MVLHMIQKKQKKKYDILEKVYELLGELVE